MKHVTFLRKKQRGKGFPHEQSVFSSGGVLIAALVIVVTLGLVGGAVAQGPDGSVTDLSPNAPPVEVAASETYQQAPLNPQAENPYLVRTFLDEEGRQIDVVIYPGRPQ